MNLKIAALDPGKNNYAYAKVNNLELNSIGMIENVITTLKDPVQFNKDVYNFRKEIRSKLKDCDTVIIERYLNRGRQAGTTSEIVNITIGILSCYFNVILYTSSTWKNFYTKNLKIDLKTKIKNQHQKDALFMIYYHYFKNNYISKIVVKRIIRQIERNEII